MSFPFVDQPAEKLPPLRIHHFMLWTAVSAVMLTVLKGDSGGNPFAGQMQASSVPYLLIYSAALTGLGLGFFWRSRGMWFFDEPGQMAFILLGISAIYTIVSAALTGYAARGNGDGQIADGMQWLMIVVGIGRLLFGLVMLVLYFRYARRFKGCGWWGNFYWWLGVITLLQYLANFIVPFFFVFASPASGNIRTMVYGMMGVQLVSHAAKMTCWVITIRTDLREKTPYHWTHWLGAAMWPALWLSAIVSWISLLLFQPDVFSG